MKLMLPLLFAIILFNPGFAQQKVSWNGYLQYRFSDNYLNQAEFSIRRAKLWLEGQLPMEEGNWNYKLQANFLQQVKYQFLLQDVLVNFKINSLAVTAGQFVPDFSLQRKQPDYSIPLVERAYVVNSLVPGAETMARDIGVELKSEIKKNGSFSLGLFNGNGANNVSGKRNLLYVNRGSLIVLDNSVAKLELGYSLSYREAKDLQFSKIFATNVTFSGNDFRFGFEEKLNIGDFEFQSEYIEAHTGNKRANGYYALADYLFSKKNLITLSIEQLKDLNPATNDEPWYAIGYSYLLKGNDIKISMDNKFQFASNKTIALTTLQIQYFFN